MIKYQLVPAVADQNPFFSSVMDKSQRMVLLVSNHRHAFLCLLAVGGRGLFLLKTVESCLVANFLSSSNLSYTDECMV